jgi:hypothetical protein
MKTSGIVYLKLFAADFSKFQQISSIDHKFGLAQGCRHIGILNGIYASSRPRVDSGGGPPVPKAS